jgi:hypothetical protein
MARSADERDSHALNVGRDVKMRAVRSIRCAMRADAILPDLAKSWSVPDGPELPWRSATVSSSAPDWTVCSETSTMHLISRRSFGGTDNATCARPELKTGSGSMPIRQLSNRPSALA